MASRVAERYRKTGVDKTAQRSLAFLGKSGIEGATVLEVGGGVGDVLLELLKLGAARTLNLELSPGYDEEAGRLIREAGVEGRAERRIHDIASDPTGVEPADAVVLNRVVCCYPDYEQLLGAAAEHARRLLVFSYPPRNLLSRFLLGAQNLLFSLQCKEYPTLAHPPARMLGVVEERGLLLTTHIDRLSGRSRDSSVAADLPRVSYSAPARAPSSSRNARAQPAPMTLPFRS